MFMLQAAVSQPVLCHQRLHAKVGNTSFPFIYFLQCYGIIVIACIVLLGVYVDLCLHITYHISYIIRTHILAYFLLLSINDSVCTAQSIVIFNFVPKQVWS
jgi:hypothetical protein